MNPQKIVNSVLVISAVSMLSGFATDASAASILSVCKQSCTYSTVQSAVNAAASGDTIKIARGTYYENIRIVNKSLTLTGAGKDFTTLDGNFAGSVIRVENITGGINPRLAVTDMTITHGSADAGGGISVFWGLLYLQDVIVTSNRATGYGGGIALGGNVDQAGEIVRCIISHNVASAPVANGVPLGGWGGGIYVAIETLLNVRDSSITRNGASADGGGIFVDYTSTSSIFDTTLSDNSAGIDGGAIAAGPVGGPGDWTTKGERAYAHLTRSTVTHNSAAHDGGGLYSIRGGIDADRSVISLNTAAHAGGASAGTEFGGVDLSRSVSVYNTPQN